MFSDVCRQNYAVVQTNSANGRKRLVYSAAADENSNLKLAALVGDRYAVLPANVTLVTQHIVDIVSAVMARASWS